jgi:hypothetical protein
VTDITAAVAMNMMVDIARLIIGSALLTGR